ncbi:unnamed protein product [Auanema sp. JU1783]|nr:unnamed protein product [Auanema sp. JU1783]
MADSNAWDMMGEDRRSKSPSRTSRVDSEILIGLDDVDLQALGLGKSELAEEVERHAQEKERKRRSKSPAIDSLRKVSMNVLHKIGAISKRKDVSVPLTRSPDIDDLPLQDFCKIPKEYFQESKPFSFRDIGRIVKPPLETKPEKCSYLFRGPSIEEEIKMECPTEKERLPEYDPYCPVHGSRRRVSRRDRLVTMQSLMSSVDHDSALDGVPNIYSQEFVRKIIRKKRIEQETPSERRRNLKTMQKIRANLWIISLSFLFLFTAFNGLQNLQSTINSELGLDSLIVMYITLAITSLFIPPFMINRLGCKLTLIGAMCVYVIYMMVNIRPTYYSMIPVSILLGAAGSCLWGAECAYIIEMGLKYAKVNYESPNSVIFRFIGYFSMIVHLGQVIGNFLSSSILTAAIKQYDIEDAVDKTCGHMFPMNTSDLSTRATDNLKRPPQRVLVAVCLAYLACAIVAVMILSMFLNALTKDVLNRNKAPHFNPLILQLTWKNLRSLKVMLLVPLTMFNGMGKAFFFGIFTKSFVGCGLGVAQIGFVGTSFGISDAVCSLVFGPLIKLFGRMPLFVFGAVVNLLMLLTLMIWPVNPADTAIFYVVACVWGMADGVWNTQISGYWVALVGRQSLEFAFTKYRLWESFGMAVGFSLMRVVSVQVYLYISAGILLFGMAGYSTIENYDKLKLYLLQMFGVCAVNQKKPAVISMEQSLISQHNC